MFLQMVYMYVLALCFPLSFAADRGKHLKFVASSYPPYAKFDAQSNSLQGPDANVADLLVHMLGRCYTYEISRVWNSKAKAKAVRQAG